MWGNWLLPSPSQGIKLNPVTLSPTVQFSFKRKRGLLFTVTSFPP